MNSSAITDTCAYRASIVHFVADPAQAAHGMRWHEDGLLVVQSGRVLACGDYATLRSVLAESIEIVDYRGKLIVPGFIDAHVHYPQTEMIASPANGLLPWLEHYTFPFERAFEDLEHAHSVAEFFVSQCLAHGTTTAMVYCTVHPHSVDALFEASSRHNLRTIAGKVLMDRHCPEFLQDTAEGGVRDSETLIERWHNKGRNLYAITPRFAPTSSDLQMQLAGELAQRYPDVFLQTHVAENTDEVKWARELYPDARSYLDVYEGFGMLRPRSMYAHCIWLDDTDRQRMHETGSAIAVCPTSNLFLGSGAFDFAQADKFEVGIALATDVGGGTSLSMLQTMNETYKLGRLRGHALSAAQLFYHATLGAARSMQLDEMIGNFRAGKEADFVVLDREATPMLARRTSRCESIEELLFAFAILGDDRAVAATYAMGRCVHQRN